MSVPTIEVEALLYNWIENPKSRKLILELPDGEALDKFKAMTVRDGKKAGQRLMAVFVQIGDDEQPVEQEQPTKRGYGATVIEAFKLCRDPDFLTWTHAQNASEAGEYIKQLCRINSRYELDDNETARNIFRTRILVPFHKWKREAA